MSGSTIAYFQENYGASRDQSAVTVSNGSAQNSPVELLAINQHGWTSSSNPYVVGFGSAVGRTNYKGVFATGINLISAHYPDTSQTSNGIVLAGGAATVAVGASTAAFTKALTYLDASTNNGATEGATFASSNTGVATINPTTGVATGVTGGTTQITATLFGVSSTPQTLTVTGSPTIASCSLLNHAGVPPVLPMNSTAQIDSICTLTDTTQTNCGLQSSGWTSGTTSCGTIAAQTGSGLFTVVKAAGNTCSSLITLDVGGGVQCTLTENVNTFPSVTLQGNVTLAGNAKVVP
jgi:hypothetical protein